MYHCTCITYMTLPIYTIYIVLHTIPPMSIPNRHCYTKCYYIVTYCNVLWRTYCVYTFCDHKYVPMWSQICIYLMWLTLSFSWSVCFCVYTIHATPCGPCPAPAKPSLPLNQSYQIAKVKRIYANVSTNHTYIPYLYRPYGKGKLLGNQLPVVCTI